MVLWWIAMIRLLLLILEVKAMKKKWTYEACYEEAKKYKTISDFQKGNPTAQKVARENGWQSDYTWFEIKRKPAGYWDYEHCYNAAKECISRSDFEDKYSTACNIARKNGWINDYTWFLSEKEVRGNANKKWTKETCYEEAKKYTSIKDFRQNSASAYGVCLKHKWIDDYTWLKRKKQSNTYWSHDRCYEAAKKCTSRSEFGKKYPAAWRRAVNNGWMSEYTWIMSRHDAMSKAFTIWTEEKCYEEAKKYNSRGELKKNCPTAYKVARKKGWLDEYTWFVTLWGKKWDYDTCKEEAKKYKSRGEFSEKSGSAWAVAKKNGWIEDYDWFEEMKLPNGYWNDYDRCYEEAKKYHCSSEFSSNNGSAYNVAVRNGWIEDYTWFETPTLKELDESCATYVIYVYEDKKHKVAYVGLSKNWKARHSAHKRMHKGKYDGVMKYFISIGKELPIPTILEEGLTPAVSRDREDHWKNEYIDKGWKVLNKGATGKNKSSLGGGFRKWNKEACYEEAKKYNSKVEMQRSCAAAYGSARKNGWLSDYTWFKKPDMHRKWNKETCYEEAKKYNCRSKFEEGSGSAWAVAKKNGWIEEYDWFVPQRNPVGYWTYDRCHEEAIKYSTRSEFQKGSPAAYSAARKNGWVSDWMDAKVRPNGYWTYERCYEEAMKYTTLMDFRAKSPAAYSAVCKNGWHNEYPWLERQLKPKGHWTKDICFEEASKYTTLKDFMDNNATVYYISRENGWIDDYVWLERVRKPHKQLA